MNKVITFFGGDSKTGTTMIAQSVSECLGEKGEKVLLIMASSELFDEYILKSESGGLGLDYIIDFKPKKEDIKKIINKNNKISYIRGTGGIGQIKKFSPNCISEIVEVIQDEYDYIVIDGGHNYQYPLPCSSLLAGDMRCYVLESRNRSIDRFTDTLSTVIKAMADQDNKKIANHISNMDDDVIIINKYERSKGTFSIENIKDLFNMDVLVVPYVPNGLNMEASGKTLFETNKSFNQAIYSVTESIISQKNDRKSNYKN